MKDKKKKEEKFLSTEMDGITYYYKPFPEFWGEMDFNKIKSQPIKYKETIEEDFKGTHTTCPYCNESVKRGILNMADHKCKS